MNSLKPAGGWMGTLGEGEPNTVGFVKEKWIDINPATYSLGCFEVSKFMIRMLST